MAFGCLRCWLPQFHDCVDTGVRGQADPDHHAAAMQGEVRGVEKEHLPHRRRIDLRVENRRRGLEGVSDECLELDTLDPTMRP